MVDTPQMPTYSQEFSEKALDLKIEVASDTVMADVQKLADSEKYSVEYKQQTIQETLDSGLESLDIIIQEVEERLNKRISDLRLLGNFRTSPLPEEVAPIEYTHNLLRSEWERQPTHLVNPPEILQRWELAIKSGDRVTARVLKDYAAPVIRNFARTDREKMASLIEQTDDMYLDESNKAARAKLKEYEVYLQNAQQQARLARQRLSGTRFKNGKLQDAGHINLNRASY